MNRRRGLSLLLALAMLLTAMPFVGAAAAQGDVAEATYIRNDTGDAVTAYTKGGDGSSVAEAGTFDAGAVWAYLGEETIAEIERRFNAQGVHYGEAGNVDGAMARRILEACR